METKPRPTVSTEMLDAFVAVADHLSVSRAATALGVGKSVISKRVAQLEAALGATLFSRSTRRIALTSAGESCIDHARRALGEVSAAQERLHELRERLAGTVRLTATVSWGQRVLAPLLPVFLHRHPDVRIELLLSDLLFDIASERIDIALRWSDTPVAAGLYDEPLARTAWRLAATPGYLAQATPLRRPEDLAAHPCMSYWSHPGDDRWTLTRGTGQREVRVRSRYQADNAEAVTAAVLGGLGIGLLPDYLCDQAIADGALARVLPGWTPQTKFGTRISAVVSPERLRLARNQALLAFLRESLAGGTGRGVRPVDLRPSASGSGDRRPTVPPSTPRPPR